MIELGALARVDQTDGTSIVGWVEEVSPNALGLRVQHQCLIWVHPNNVRVVDPVKERLESIRAAIHAENVSYGEIAELEGLAEHIDPGDVELLEWAGVPEFPEDEEV